MKNPSKFFLISTAFLMTIAANAVAGGGGEPCANGGQGGQGGQGCTIESERQVTTSDNRVITEYRLRSDAGQLVTRYRDNEDRIVVLSGREQRQLRRANRIEARKERIEARLDARRDRHLDKAAGARSEINSIRRENSQIARNLGGRAVYHSESGSSHSTSSSSGSMHSGHSVNHSHEQFPAPSTGCPNGMIEVQGVCYGADLFEDGECDEVKTSSSSGGQGDTGGQGKTDPKPEPTQPEPTKPLPDVKPVEPAKPTRPAPVKKPLPEVKPATPAKPTRPAPVKKPVEEVKPAPVAQKDPCEDDLKAKNAELERIKMEQAAKDEAARLERERLQAEADAAKAKQAEDESVVDLKIKSKDKFKERVWVPTIAGGHYETVRSDLKVKIKAKKIRTGEANLIIDHVSEMKSEHAKNVNELRAKYGLLDPISTVGEAAQKAARSSAAN